MADATKVKLGTCNIIANGTDVGHSAGGCEGSYEPTYTDITVDMYGSTPVNKVLTGEKMTAKVPFAESTLANLLLAIPQGTASATKLTIGSKAGKLASADAISLVLHPQANAAGDRSEDFVILKAVASSPVMLPYKNEGARVFEVTFEGIIDETKADGAYLGLIGDSAT